MMNSIEGLITAPFTPFGKDGKINLHIISDLAEFYKRNGIAGVFIGGTTGECSSLTFNEKIKLFETWSKYKSVNFKIIAFLGGTCAAECKQLALAAQQYNLDAVAMTAPYYFKPSGVEELAAFCAEIAAAVPLPFYYYHIPSFTGVFYNMYDLLTCVDGKIPNFAGIKYTYENMMDYQRCLEYKNRKYNILWGRDEMLLSALVVGATGAVGSTYGYTAPVYLKIMEAYKKFDMETARALQLKAAEYITFLHKYGGATGKAFMKAVGKDCGNYRLPVRNLSDAQMQQFLAELKATDFYEYCSI
ncbi:MAG: dihydrodipicolinate synthase family protein [Prevotellaceae bacterium]|jgi:N-acetylneuraminate lyase|nr:dihydrodipicolinate synthase family protein [Prevotellaceae bacterium]